MKVERTKNAKRNGMWGMICRVVELFLKFVSRTIIIKFLGADYLGLDGLFTSILTVLNLTELGVGSAIVYSMYKPIATGDNDLICALLNLYRKIYKVIGTSIIILGLILLPFIRNLVNGEIPKDINVYILFILYIINTSVSYLLFAYKRSLIHAYQRDDVTSKITIVTNLVLSALQILFLTVTHNYYWYIILQILMMIISNILNSYYANKLFPECHCEGTISISIKRDIKQRVTGLMIINIAAASRNALDSVIVSLFLGLEVVAIYNNYYYVMNSVSSILVVLMSAIAAGVGNSVAIESKNKNLEDMRNINFAYMMISGICMSCLITMYQPFMRLWVGDKYLFNDNIMIMFTIYFILGRIGDVQAQYFDAAGLWWHGKMRGIIESVANLVLNIILGYYWGVIGIVLATIFTMIFINLPLATYYIFKYYFNQSMISYVKEQISIVGKIIICSIICYLISNIFPEGINLLQQIIVMILKGFISAIIFSILFVILNLKNERFKTSMLWIKSKIKYF